MEKRFPEKISAEEVLGAIESIKSRAAIQERSLNSHYERISSLEKLHETIKKLTEEVNTLKTQATFKTRTIVAPDPMTPFAQRFQNAGGNKSPQ